MRVGLRSGTFPARKAVPSFRMSESLMGDPYEPKPAPNLTFWDVAGLLVVAALGAIGLYLLVMLVYHLFAGRLPAG